MAKNPRIRMLTAAGGDNFSLSGGEETDRFPVQECFNLVATHQAEWVDGPPAPRKRAETATRKPSETRAKVAGAVKRIAAHVRGR